VVEPVQLLGQPHRHRTVAAEQQIQGGVGVGQSAGGVDPRPQSESAGGGVHRVVGVYAGHLQQRGQAQPSATGQLAQAVAHQQPIGAHQWHHVRHRTQGDEIKVVL
jgi:hypothetical protein